MLHVIFVGFTFNTNLSIFKAKTRERKLFYHEQINRSTQALFFLFQAVIGYISSNHGMCYIKKTRAQASSASAVERLECLVDLRYLICERFKQQGSGYLLQKCTIFTGKKRPCISQGIKKT